MRRKRVDPITRLATIAILLDELCHPSKTGDEKDSPNHLVGHLELRPPAENFDYRHAIAWIASDVVIGLFTGCCSKDPSSIHRALYGLVPLHKLVDFMLGKTHDCLLATIMGHLVSAIDAIGTWSHMCKTKRYRDKKYRTEGKVKKLRQN